MIADIDIAVCINLYILAVGCKQQIQDMIAVEFRHPAPAAATHRATLHFFVVAGIDSIEKRSYSYCVCHNSVI